MTYYKSQIPVIPLWYGLNSYKIRLTVAVGCSVQVFTYTIRIVMPCKCKSPSEHKHAVKISSFIHKEPQHLFI